MKKLIDSLFIFLVLLKISVSYAAWLPSPPEKMKLCSRCHGENGKSTQTRYPKLAGQYEAYIIKQLRDFQQGSQGPRYNPLMLTISRELTDSDIQQLAAYYAYQTPEQGFAHNKNLAWGRKLYQGGIRQRGIPACSACHGPAGEGKPAAKFPRLAGQHSHYIVNQLISFQQHQRHNDARGIMQDITTKLSAEDILAVANYISGLHD